MSTRPLRSSRGVQFDIGYLKTFPGLLKLFEVFFSLGGFISDQYISPDAFYAGGAGTGYAFVSMAAFFISFFFLMLYLFHIVEVYSRFFWNLTEAIYCILMTLCFFIVSCVAFSKAKQDVNWAGAAFFGFCAMVAFAFEAYIKHNSWADGEPAQEPMVDYTADIEELRQP